MSFWQKIKSSVASFLAGGAINLPPSGRSSDESLHGLINSSLANYSSVSPVVDFESLKLLKNFAIFNPDVSQFCQNIINLANTGHTIQIDAGSDAAAEAALNRLNETAARVYRNGAGVDGLMNAYLFQIAWSGALSSEDVVNVAGRRVEHTVLVPVEQIRFRYDAAEDRYKPYQRPLNFTGGNRRDAFGLIPLHAETYRYYALQTVENSPYAKPPASAAIETIIESQKPILENIQFIAQKFGLLGLFTASLTPPPKKPGESEGEYQNRAVAYRSSVLQALSSELRKGLLVAFRDQKIEHTNIAEGASGVYDLNRISEEQVFSGLGMQPAFFGRTDSTTETYADVVYNLLIAQVHNIQRLAKRRQERTYRLDLRLGGLDVDGVSIKFNRTYSRNVLQENQATQVQWQTVFEKVKNGVIAPDTGAQKLGYETWFDPEMIADAPPSVAALMRAEQKLMKKLSFRFDFKRDAQRYEFVRPTINLSSATEETETSSGNVIPIKKKAQQA